MTTLAALPLCLLLAAAEAPSKAPAAAAQAPAQAAAQAPAQAAAQAPAQSAAQAPTQSAVPLAPLLDGAAAWRTARWGMTVDEVLKAFPGQARRLEKELKLPDGLSVAVEIQGIDLAGLTCRAHFLFEGGKLALVSLKSMPPRLATGKDYDAAKARLAAETGQAGVERPDDGTVDYREIRFTAGATAVDLKYLDGTLVLLYHPTGA